MKNSRIIPVYTKVPFTIRFNLAMSPSHYKLLCLPTHYFCIKKGIASASFILSSPIVYLKGVGPQRAELLQKELGIFTFADLLHHYPYRYIDKTTVTLIGDFNAVQEYGQFAGILTSSEVIGERKGKRLIATLQDPSGVIELVWFQGINWVQKNLHIGLRYLVFGKVSYFMGKPQIVHPEMEGWNQEKMQGKSYLEPVYPSTEKLKSKNLSGRQIARLTETLLQQLGRKDIPENLPASIIGRLKLISRFESLQAIHFPANLQQAEQATRRIKFEEIFFAQLGMSLVRVNRHRASKGVLFEKVGELFNQFYNESLPFDLTNAQKRVIKEIRKDTGSGRQMNRLLQGDVGSGKTIVALLCMLLAVDNGYQAVMMAPTEILAKQHYESVNSLVKKLGIGVSLLTGSTKTKERKIILENLANGTLSLLIGTHAVIEDPVVFKNLGLAIIDEQHRFGVAQRARLWNKAATPPHVLVMTATPIPRTLAMTAYGDLDYSIIDELPPGRKPVQTVHRYDTDRAYVMNFIRSQIDAGRQAYVIFPLIEESEKLDYENLVRGFQEIESYFPSPPYRLSMVHGKMQASLKETNMRRFVEHDTHIMVSTTVIEVGVNVPNATVMLIESAEKFGLSQLHQLRGRVGRGAEKSYCVLLTGRKLSNDARERMKIMTSTTDGFVIAEKDMELRGPGDIEGTRQSGVLNFKMADIVKDQAIIQVAKQVVDDLLKDDPTLIKPENSCLQEYLRQRKGKIPWSKIS